LLVVEDEKEIAERLRHGLERVGFVVEIARDGETAWFKAEVEDYEAIVLDLGLPKLDGLSVIRKLRGAGVSTPILALSARGSWSERVEGIDAGADDYLPKPFQIEEVISRLGALTRRKAGQLTPVLIIGDVRIDTRRLTVTAGDKEVTLSPLEYRALHCLARNKGRAVSQGELREQVYGGDGETDSNTLEVLIGRLRRKLPKDFIMTRRGFGYYVGDSEETAS
jgi:DNA-binding response OmpR family regulator